MPRYPSNSEYGAKNLVDFILRLKNDVSSSMPSYMEYTWQLSEAVAANSIITLPNGLWYTAGQYRLKLSYDGVVLNRWRWEEVGAAGEASTQIRLLISLPAGTEITAWIAYGANGDGYSGGGSGADADLVHYYGEKASAAQLPAVAADGDIWYVSGNDTFYFYTGGTWRALSSKKYAAYVEELPSDPVELAALAAVLEEGAVLTVKNAQ